MTAYWGLSAGMFAQVPVQVVEFWEALYNDDDGKDIELKARDGSVWAHALILAQMSEPIKMMLSAGMAEQRTSSIQMKAFSAAHLKFILRFVYTGHMEPADWDGVAARPSRMSIGRKLKQPRTRKLLVAPTRPDGQGGASAASAASAESMATLGPSVTLVRRRKSLSSHCRASAELKDCRKMASPSSDTSGSSEDGDLCGAVPLELLLGGLSFAKQFQMTGFANVILDYIRIRLTHANFEKVMQRAIAIDMSPLKLMCLKHAERNSKIRQVFDKGAFCPEVMFELQALWSPPRCKKQRISLI